MTLVGYARVSALEQDPVPQFAATVGYGDIFPVNPIARVLANLEAVIGQLYPATTLARFVTLVFIIGREVCR